MRGPMRGRRVLMFCRAFRACMNSRGLQVCAIYSFYSWIKAVVPHIGGQCGQPAYKQK